MSSPQRCFQKALRSIGQGVPGVDIMPLALDLVRRIRGIRHRTQAGAYLLADEGGHVFLLAEGAATTRHLLATHVRLLVGLYAGPVFPTPAELRDDLTAHWLEIGYLTPQRIYDCIRDEEG